MLWKAALVREHNVDGHRLYIYRSVSDREIEVVTALGPGAPEIERQDVYLMQSGLLLPAGAGDAIQEQFTPVTSQGEIRRLEESLKHERGRVDDVLAALLPAVS